MPEPKRYPSRRWSARSLKNMRGIHPDLRRVLDRALYHSPLDFIVIEGLRSVERQLQLFESGASKTMNSRHLTGHAVDLLPIGPDGKAAFDWPLYDILGPAIEAAANAEGVAIVWGGRWASFRDGPHFELDRRAYPVSDWQTGDPAPKGRASIDDHGSTGAAAGAAGAGAVAVAVELLPHANGLLADLEPAVQALAVILAAGLFAYFMWSRR